MDFYRLLNVSRGAGIAEIKQSFRKLALSLHPDVNGGDKAKAEQFRKVCTAYAVLSNEAEKAKYDRTAGGSESFGTAVRATRAPNSYHDSFRYKTRRYTGEDLPTYKVTDWEAWHYGEGNVYVQDAIRQANSFMNMEGNKHADFFNKLRNRQREAEVSAERDRQANAQRNAVQNLRKSRAQRRGEGSEGVSGSGANHTGGSVCVVQ